MLGLDFFSPVRVMGLIEIVVGFDTADELVELAQAMLAVERRVDAAERV